MYFDAMDHLSARQAFVDEINKIATTWNASIEHGWKHEPIGAFKDVLGVHSNNMAMIDAGISTGEIVISDYVRDDIPESFQAAEHWPECADLINTARDQSNCGCCWAFGPVKAASARMCIASGGTLKMPLSAQDVCFNSNYNGCGGGQTSVAWNYMKRSGVVTGGQYGSTEGYCADFSLPHCHHHGPQGNDPYPAEGKPGCPNEHSPTGPSHCDSAARGKHTSFHDDKYTFSGKVVSFRSERAIQTAIMTDGPVASAFTVYSDFENYDGGIYQHTTGTMAGGHAIEIVGWGIEDGVKFWTVSNSWNNFWGENGNFRIKRGNDECGIESQAIASASGSTYAKKY